MGWQKRRLKTNLHACLTPIADTAALSLRGDFDRRLIPSIGLGMPVRREERVQVGYLDDLDVP